MAWVTPITWSACSVVTAAQLNQQLRDNLNATAVAAYTTKGDSFWATGATAGQRIGVGADGTAIIANSACVAGVQAATTFTTAIASTCATQSLSALFYVIGACQTGWGEFALTAHSVANKWRFIADNGSAGGALGFGGCSLQLYYGGSQLMIFQGGSTFGLISTNCPAQLLVGAAACNTNMTGGGITIKTSASPEAFALKQTGLTHGFTTVTETDTYASFYSGVTGGLNLFGLSKTQQWSIYLNGYTATTADTTKTVNAIGVNRINGAGISGAAAGNLAASANLVVFENNSFARFIFEADGASYERVGTAFTVFDEHDDLALLNMVTAHLAPDPIRYNFGEWLKTNRQQLQDLNLVVFNEDGEHFVNRSRMQELLIGAVRQQGERTRQLESRLAQLEHLLSPPDYGAGGDGVTVGQPPGGGDG